MTCCCRQLVVASLFSHAANISGATGQQEQLRGTGLPIDGC